MKNHKAFSIVELAMVMIAISIFITGAMQSTRLVDAMRLNAARSLSVNSAVPSIKNLYAWWDSTADYAFLDRETEDESNISAWYDQNPQYAYRHNLFQTNVDYKPIFIQKGISLLPAIQFDGADFLKTAIDPKVILANGSATIFMVFEAQDPTLQSFILMQPIKNCTNNLEIGYSAGSISKSFSIHAGCHYATSSPENTVMDKTPLLVTTVFLEGPIEMNEADNIRIYKNGKALPLAIEGIGGYNAGLFGQYPKGEAPIIMGARDSNHLNKYDAFFKGKIGEIIIYDRALSDKERLLVQEYLLKKWSIDRDSLK